MKNPYVVLGLNEDVSDEELKARYEELKAQYSEDRFLSGAAGNTAAMKLTELETAWTDIQALRIKAEAKREYGTDYGYIDKLIRDGKYDEAQNMLDAISVRPAEWHYLQSIIFYKREWMQESRTQLQMAVNSEPWNDKYKTALEKLDLVMGNSRTQAHTIGVDPNAPPPLSNEQACGNSCSNCCLAYCLLDCCCSMGQCC